MLGVVLGPMAGCLAVSGWLRARRLWCVPHDTTEGNISVFFGHLACWLFDLAFAWTAEWNRAF